MNEVSLPAGQMTTLASGMSGTCTTVTLGSSNGWNTNFDNVVFDSATPPTAAPTRTPVPPAATPTRTPVPSNPSPTPTAGSAGTSGVVGFDDLSSPNRPLTGSYGSMDWGSGAWWLAGPYAQFSSNSVSFNGATLRSATINIPTPRRLIQVDADNGGTATTTVSLSCSGQPTVQANVAPRQVVTLRTNWSATCNRVTIASSNGWDTNFDNLVLSSTSGGTSSTSTPVPAATSTPARTPAPSTTRTVTFDDLSNPNRALTGQYPNGSIDWGNGAWYLSGPYGGFTSKSVSFNGAGPTSASLTVLSGTLLSVDAHNGGTTTSVVTLACGSQPIARAQLAPNQTLTLSTGWTSACGGITLSSSNGWNTNFDNLVLR
jgi:hypothetical protein